MSFDAPAVLLLAPVIGGVVWFTAAWARRVRVQRAARWSPDAAAQAHRAGPLGPTGVSVAAFLGVIALAGPRWGHERIEAETRGLNLVFVMDISRSMLAEDAGGTSRLNRAVREARRLAQDLDGDRLGLVAFAGASYILSPLSVDNSALTLYLDALDPDIASQGGTALAPALGMGGELLGAESQLADRVLVVFTDGEAHDSLAAALTAAQQLADQGVHVILVAEGGQAGARIPLRDDRGALVGYQQDDSGHVIETRRRDDVLSAVADAARGTIVASELPDQAGAVRDLVSSFKRSRSTETSTEYGRPRAWIPLLAALLVLFGQALLRRTAALVGVLVVLSLGESTAVGAQVPVPDRRRTPAERAWDRGDTTAARTWYLAALAAAGQGNDTLWYNAGTAAMAAGDFSTARSALAHAASSLDPTVRFLALYNEGVLGLRAAAQDSVHRDAHLGEAERASREALLLRPHDVAAKWNLELAQRRRKQGGGGSSNSPPSRSSGQGGAPPGRPQTGQPPPSGQTGGMSQAQADEILRSIGQEELQTRRERNARIRRAVERGEKDW